MQHTLGKLTNKDGGGTLEFSLNPTDLKLSRSFEYNVEPCLGQASPLVSFKGAQPSSLSFQLKFDKDIDKKSDPKAATEFLKGLNVVKADTMSVPVVEFTLGSLNFRGYVSSYQMNASRFDDKGDAVSVSIDFTLISNGETENG